MSKIFIIAEAGVNHNGCIELAHQLIDCAADAGADAVKFQTFKAENLVSKSAEKASYQKCNTSKEETHFEMIKKLELGYEDHINLVRYCISKNIMFMSTPFDLDSIFLLNDLEMGIFKIASGEITNLPYLREIGRLRKKVILSTGMSTLIEIREALDVLTNSGTPMSHITVLHATTEYPAPLEEVNLNSMRTISDEFNVDVGYSDHTLGIEVSIAAVALGAKVIEKHFTLDRHLPGPDHQASLEPDELKRMVLGIRKIEKALGSYEKYPSNSELKNLKIARKSIVATKKILSGEVFTRENVSCKRPGLGLSPMKWDLLLGKEALREYKSEELIDIKELDG